MAGRDRAVRDQQNTEGKEGTEAERPRAAEAAPGLPRDARHARPGIEKPSPPARLLLRWESGRTLAGRRAPLAAPRGRARRKVRVGPGRGLTHRRPGRYTAAMAPGRGLRGGREKRAEPGR